MIKINRGVYMVLTFKKFMSLSREEQNIRYRELSAHDKFLARMSDTGVDIDSKASKPLTKEEVIKIAKELGIKENKL